MWYPCPPPSSMSNEKVYRIYRDVRFSNDKTLYKVNSCGKLDWLRITFQLRGHELGGKVLMQSIISISAPMGAQFWGISSCNQGFEMLEVASRNPMLVISPECAMPSIADLVNSRNLYRNLFSRNCLAELRDYSYGIINWRPRPRWDIIQTNELSWR